MSMNILGMKLNRAGSAGTVLVLALVLMWSFIAYDLEKSRQQAFHNATVQLENLVSLYAEELSSSIATIDYALNDLRSEWKSNPIEFDALIAAPRNHLHPSVAFNVGIINREGRLIFSSVAPNAPLVDVSDRNHFTFHVTTQADELYVSKPVLLREANRWAVQFSRPLEDSSGQFNGVIVLSVSPEYFYRFHDKLNLGENSSIMLALASGEVIARSPRPELALGNTITGAPWVGGRPLTSGTFRRYSQVDEVARLYAWRILEDGRLTIIMGQSIESILAAFHHQKRTYLWWGFGATLLALLAAWLLRRARQQRARNEAEMREMEEALSHAQRLESIGKLTGGVTHDFNNILQIISSNVDLLRATGQPGPQGGIHLESIAAAVDRGSKLASQLLTFARRHPLHPARVKVEELIRQVDRLIQRLVGDGIEVQISVQEGIWDIYVDATQLENVLFNLCSNARDAMHGKGRLDIRLSNQEMSEEHVASYPGVIPGEYVSLKVSDTGTGIPPEAMQQVFEPFFTTKPKGKGTGLGLAAAYGFAKSSGGHIRIKSKVGSGTTIQLLLPRAAEQVQVEPEPEQDLRPEQAEAKVEAEAEVRNGSILLVEDNAELRKMTGFILAASGYSVIEAANAEKALEVLENEKCVDVLFTDISMPGEMNGIDLARRARERCPELVVLFTSGADIDESAMQEEYQEQDLPLLRKPYTAQEIMSMLKKLSAPATGVKNG